jgi:hypothetical protein
MVCPTASQRHHKFGKGKICQTQQQSNSQYWSDNQSRADAAGLQGQQFITASHQTHANKSTHKNTHGDTLLSYEREFQQKVLQRYRQGEFRLQEIIYPFKEIDDQVQGNNDSQAYSNDLDEFQNDVAADNPHGDYFL